MLITFKSTEDRIKNEIGNLKNRAKVNLIIGVIITVGGLGTLFAFILWGQEDISKVVDTISLAKLTLYWISKLSLVVLIEIFALFFLRMYRDNMETIKYYQNELTSIESRKIALLFSILHETPDAISNSLQTLNGIDRNFIFHKEHTTVELEKMRLSNDSMKEQIENMWGLLKNIASFNKD